MAFSIKQVLTAASLGIWLSFLNVLKLRSRRYKCNLSNKRLTSGYKLVNFVNQCCQYAFSKIDRHLSASLSMQQERCHTAETRGNLNCNFFQSFLGNVPGAAHCLRFDPLYYQVCFCTDTIRCVLYRGSWISSPSQMILSPDHLESLFMEKCPPIPSPPLLTWTPEHKAFPGFGNGLCVAFAIFATISQYLSKRLQTGFTWRLSLPTNGSRLLPQSPVSPFHQRLVFTKCTHCN